MSGWVDEWMGGWIYRWIKFEKNIKKHKTIIDYQFKFSQVELSIFKDVLSRNHF